MSELLSLIVSYVWGLPLVILLVGGGLYLMFVSRFLPMRGFFHALQLISGKVHFKDDAKAEGQINHFQALMTALSATVGLGNIAGVAVALSQGGPGAIFWMWVTAFIGMNTKFFECTLSVMHRGHDYKGEVQGGPMYVIENVFPKSLRWLAVMFAICGLVGTLSLFQVNQLSSYLSDEFTIQPWVTGTISAFFIGYVLLGGLKRIVAVTSRLVPFMCVFYVIGALGVVVTRIDLVPSVFMRIFSEAFQLDAVAGGAWGTAFLMVLKTGVKRAAFSNEAGMGTAPMAHGNVKTSEPVSEGFVGMLGPFLDTVIVCTLTALVILLALPENFSSESGILMTLRAFEEVYGSWGQVVLGLSIFIFSTTTMVGMSNYNMKCWNYLFKGRWKFGDKSFIAFYMSTMLLGALTEMEDVVNLLDIGYALMAFPNMIATIWLAPRVKSALDNYIKKHISVKEPS